MAISQVGPGKIWVKGPDGEWRYLGEIGPGAWVINFVRPENNPEGE
jgi:hypothetical protein